MINGVIRRAKMNKESFKKFHKLIKKHSKFKNIKGPVEIDEEHGIIKIGSLIAPIEVIREILEDVKQS